MKGIHIINDTNGNPAVLAIDLNHLAPTISPLVEGLLARIQQAEETDERATWRSLAHASLNRAYSAEMIRQ
jgi:hypothetical protein